MGIESIGSDIKTTMSTARKPASDIPPFYTTIEGMMRPGLSAIALTSSIISRFGVLQTLPDGSEPILGKLLRIQNEELIKEIQLNMKGMTEIKPGTLMGMAGNVPVISTIPIQGSTINL